MITKCDKPVLFMS